MALKSCGVLLLIAMMVAPATSQTTVSTANSTPPPKKPQTVPTFVRKVDARGLIAGISVKVNGALVNFGSGEPVESDGRILVPMRGVFEALGAEVKYNPETQMINAVRGTTTIALRPGDESAQVNGETRTLETPAQIVNGSAVVPLRFVSEALGAKVKWNPETLEVSVNTEALEALKLPVAPSKNAIVGMLTGIFPEAKMVTVRLPVGNEVRVPLTYDVSATRRTIGPALPINAKSATAPVFAADALKVGEQVQVEMNEEGEGVLVLVNTDIRRGEIKAIQPFPATGGPQITLTDGSVITMIKEPLVRFQNRPVALYTIKPAEQVVIRLNEKGEGASLVVVTPGATNMIPPLPGTVPDPLPLSAIPAPKVTPIIPATTPKGKSKKEPAKVAPKKPVVAAPKPVVPEPVPAPEPTTDRPPA